MAHRRGFTVISLSLVLILSLIGIIFFVPQIIQRAVDFSRATCWKNTLQPLNDITTTGPIVGSGNRIGGQDVRFSLFLNKDCTDRILFQNRQACLAVCEDNDDGYEPDGKECMEECSKCAQGEGCIIVVPHTPSEWKIWQYVTGGDEGLTGIDRAKQIAADVVTYPTKQQFIGETRFIPADDKEKLFACVTMSLQPWGPVYSVRSSRVPSSSKCMA